MDIKDYIFIALVLVAISAYLYIGFKKGELRERVYKLMLIAEKEWEEGEGDAKFAYVLNEVYEWLPKSLKMLCFQNKEELAVFVQKLYKKAKDYLDDGKLNKSV